MRVKDVMTKDIISVDKDVNLQYVLNLMKKHDVTKIPVVENNKLIGVATDNMIAVKLGSKRKRGVPASRLHASSVTDKNIEKIDPNADVTKADLLPLVKSKKQLREIMQKKIHAVSPDDRVIHARRVMITENCARLPVISKGKLCGMISDTEIAFALANVKRSLPLGRQKHRLDELLVEEVMKTPVIWTKPEIAAYDAAKMMMKNNVGALMLIENNNIVGIVTRTDLLKTISI
jgi:CBS domain-containing protein